MATTKKKLSGQILEVPPAKPGMVLKGDPELAEARAVLFRAQVRESQALRRIMDGAVKKIEDSAGAQPVTVDDTRMLKASERSATKAAEKGIRDAFVEADHEVEAGVRRSISRATRAQVAHLEKLGIRPPTPEQIRRIRESVANLMNEEFPPGSGMTYSMRMELNRREHTRQIKGVLRQKYPDGGASQRIARDVKVGLTDTRSVRTPLRGGSASKKLRRIIVAEETRLANRAEVAIMRVSGVAFAYWRLNPTHPWYGGREVCEWYASRTDSATVDILATLGITLPASALQGLYRLDNYPDYPHPFCKCYPEPWFPTKFKPKLRELSSAAQATGRSTADLLAAGSAMVIGALSVERARKREAELEESP